MIPQQISQVPPKPFLLMILGFIVIAQSLYIITGISKKQTVVVLPPTPTPEVIPTKTLPTSIPDKTANWKTYTNETHGYSIKMPDEFDYGVAKDYANPENSVGIGNKNIDIGIITDPWTSVCANSSSCEKMRLVTITLDGKNNSAQEYYVNRGFPYARYWFQSEGIRTNKNTGIYLLVNYKKQEDLDEIIQILSTFKFTD